MKLLPGGAIARPISPSDDTFAWQVLTWPFFLAWLFYRAIGHVNPVLFAWIIFKRKVLPEIGVGVILAQAVFMAAVLVGVWFVILVLNVFRNVY